MEDAQGRASPPGESVTRKLSALRSPHVDSVGDARRAVSEVRFGETVTDVCSPIMSDASDSPKAEERSDLRTQSMKSDPADYHGDGRLRSTASNPSLLSRKGSLATRAFEQMQKNRAVEYQRDLEISRIEREAEQMLSIVQRRESLMADSAFGIQNFKGQCRAAFASRKAANKMLKGLKQARFQKPKEDEDSTTANVIGARTRNLEHRSVLKVGPVAPRFREAIEMAASGAPSAWMSRRPSTAVGPRADTDPSSHFSYAARPSTAPAGWTGGTARSTGARGVVQQQNKVGDSLPGSPCSQVTMTTAPEGEVLKEEKRPARAAWEEKRRQVLVEPTMRSFVSVMPDTLNVLTNPVDWGRLLSDQREQRLQADESDVKYRRMIEKYETYQRLIQRRLNRILRLGLFNMGDEDSDPDTPQESPIAQSPFPSTTSVPAATDQQ